MESPPPSPPTPAPTPSDWSDRERYWRRKLGRLRLGAEPLEEQVGRYRRVTWALTIVPMAIGLMFVALFTAFGRPEVGAILAALILLPIVAWAWLDFARLRRRAERYRVERAEFDRREARSG